MLRELAVIGLSLSLVSAPARAVDQISGILTLGCGDASLGEVNAGSQRPPMSLVAVRLTPEQTEQVFTLAGLKETVHRGLWTSLYVDLEGELSQETVSGYFGAYAQTFKVTYVRRSRLLKVGESPAAYADEIQDYSGYMVVSREVVAFFPVDHLGEVWWITSNGDAVNAQIEKHFGKYDYENARGFETQYARVRLEGWVGPPGMYGHMSGFIREIVVAHIDYKGKVTLEDLEAAGIADERKAPLLSCAPLK